MMNSNKLLSRIEALLFVAGDEGMTVKQLAQYIDVDIMDIEAGLSELQSQYNEEEQRGITIKQMAGTYQLTTKPEVSDTLKKLIENTTTTSTIRTETASRITTASASVSVQQ